MRLEHYRIMMLSGQSAAKHRSFHPIILEIDSEAFHGLGEACTVIGGNGTAVVEAIRDFAEFLLGKEIDDIFFIRQQLKKQYFWLMNPGIILGGALSAVDIALWDLKARVNEVPLWRLLGERKRERFLSYASQLQFGWGTSLGSPRVSPSELADAAVEAVSQGYQVLKFDPMGYDAQGSWKGLKLQGEVSEETLSLIEARVSAVRSAVGEDIGLILENHCLTDAKSAAAIGERLEPYHFLMMEEPVEPLQMKTLPYVKNRCNLSLAMGEKLASAEEFVGPINDGTMNIAQPDIGICGGVTALLRIANMAETAGVPVTPHCCHSPVSTAATLHCEAVMSNFLLHEVHATATMMKNIDLCKPAVFPQRGYYNLPEGPGIGVEISEEARKKAQIIYEN